MKVKLLRSLSASKELLRRLYGFEFPESLFFLHEFLAGMSAEEWQSVSSTLGIEPIGLLHVLSLSDIEIEKLNPGRPLLLHDRFYEDVPEFFTCIKGDQDWLHWGLLLDEPAKGFRGAASCYSNDTSTMCVYPSLFSAILTRIEERSDPAEPSDAEEKETYRAMQEHLRRFSDNIRGFIEARRIPLDDGRGQGLPSDTGLDLMVAGEGKGWFSTIWGPARSRRSDWSVFPPTGHPHIVHIGAMKAAREIEHLVRRAVAASERGQALPALSLGRSLWYWKDRRDLANSRHGYASIGFDLLSRAYTLLDRPALRHVLQAHFLHLDHD